MRRTFTELLEAARPFLAAGLASPKEKIELTKPLTYVPSSGESVHGYRISLTVTLAQLRDLQIAIGHADDLRPPVWSRED